MARKKADSTEKSKKASKSHTKANTKKTKKTKKPIQPSDDASMVIVDDDLEIDKEKEHEERRAYLEEARSQETSD